MRSYRLSVAVLIPLLVAPRPGDATEDDGRHGRLAYAILLKREAVAVGIPVDVADAVMAVESGYDPTKVGGVGEVGLMQVLPSTAAMLGFTGSPADLAEPDANIHYGVTYLAGAWRRAGGDLCRALMKYRAGHGEETMTARSVQYCTRARAHLASLGSPFARATIPVAAATPDPASAPRRRTASIPAVNPKLRGAAFWAAHDLRIKTLTARVERRWHMMAARQD